MAHTVTAKIPSSPKYPEAPGVNDRLQKERVTFLSAKLSASHLTENLGMDSAAEDGLTLKTLLLADVARTALPLPERGATQRRATRMPK